jgi:nitroreductase
MKTINNRTTNYPVNEIFLRRYSSRAMSGEIIPKEELMTLFEAARWAPSSNNSQPWRFVYTTNGTPEFELLFSSLADGNKTWCAKASLLILIVSLTKMENGGENIYRHFDAGSAWENFALQASQMNLVVHAIGGFDKNFVKEKFPVPENYSIEIMIALGKRGKIEDLPSQFQAREKPSERKPLEEIVFEGKFI